MLFKVHSDLATEDKFFEMNPGALAIEEFNKCTSRQMFFVCLIADRDYDSPFRTLPERTRRERAVVTAGYPMEGNRPDKNGRNLISGKVERVEAAIAKYRELQYDEDRAMRDALDAQIQEALLAIAANKEDKAKVVKTTKNKAGETIKEEYVDAKMVIALRAESVNLAKSLPALKKARTELLATMDTGSALDNVITHTSQDLADLDEDEDLIDAGGGSTLDMYNEKIKEQENL